MAVKILMATVKILTSS